MYPVASALSGAFGGLIAFGILYMDGVAGWPGWRWLYVLEGILTIAFAGLCVKLVPKNYQTASFLNAEDKKIMAIRAELSESYSGGDGHPKLKDLKLAWGDAKTWLHGVSQIAVVTILYGFGTFLPIIIKNGLKYSTKQAQYLVIPVNIWGAIVYAVGAVISDRYNKRFLIMVVCAPIGIAGYAILLKMDSVTVGAQYFATYLIATACFLCTGGNIAWMTGNVAPDGKRAAALGELFEYCSREKTDNGFQVRNSRSRTWEELSPARSTLRPMLLITRSAIHGLWAALLLPSSYSTSSEYCMWDGRRRRTSYELKGWSRRRTTSQIVARNSSINSERH
jgi:MFS family permease